MSRLPTTEAELAGIVASALTTHKSAEAAALRRSFEEDQRKDLVALRTHVARADRAENQRDALLSAAMGALAFYDNLGRDHEPGEAKVLDDLSAAIATAGVKR